MTRVAVPFIFLAALLAGCAGSPKQMGEVSGYVVPTTSLVPEEKLRVSVALEDVSLADAPAVIISEAEYELIPYWPLPYALAYDPEKLDFRHSYALRARVSTLGGTLLAINDTRHTFTPGLDSGKSDILVRPLDRNPSILARFTANCAGEEYSLEVYEALISRLNRNSLSVQAFLRVAAASGTKYQRENETIWTKGDDDMLYLVDDVKVDCIVSPGV